MVSCLLFWKAYKEWNGHLILIDLNASTIMEWDISDSSVYHPFFVGNYELYSFILDPSFQPVYHPVPNHLLVSAFKDSIPYILVFQPGNNATSSLIYAINLEDIMSSEGYSPLTADGPLIVSIYNYINQYTMLFLYNSSNLSFFWVSNSPLAFLNEISLEQSNCLYCSGDTLINISSDVLPDSATSYNISVPYMMIFAEQFVAIQNPSSQFEIYYEQPLCIIPNDLFQGTPLEYNLGSSESSRDILYIQGPVILTNSFETEANLGYTYDFQPQVSLFSDGQMLYILNGNISWIVDMHSIPFQIETLEMTNFAYDSVNFLSGDYDNSQNLSAFAYSTQTFWGVYTPSNGANYTIQDQIVKIEVIGSLIFVLVQEGFELIYILNSNQTSLDCVMSIKSGLFINPSDFAVENLYEDIYSISIVDGSDTVYCTIVNLTSGVSQFQSLSNLTSMFENDLPQETLEIAAIQSVTNTVQNQISVIEYALFITNFHSYQVQIFYTQEAQIGNITKCFVQMPGHTSLGYSAVTDFYYLDIKQKGELYYLYSYPLNLTYNYNGQQSGEYPYVKPIQRQVIDIPYSIGLYALDGESGIAFLISTKPIDGIYSQYMSQNITFQAYSMKNYLEIGFDPSLDYAGLSSLGVIQANIALTNDISNSILPLTLYTQRNFIRSAFFIAIMCLLPVILPFLGLIIYRRIQSSKESSDRKNPEDSTFSTNS